MDVISAGIWQYPEARAELLGEDWWVIAGAHQVRVLPRDVVHDDDNFDTGPSSKDVPHLDASLHYASLLIRHGESVKTVQARLGHANTAETLDTYSHLWPDSDDRTREAVDHVLGHPAQYMLSTASTS